MHVTSSGAVCGIVVLLSAVISGAAEPPATDSSLPFETILRAETRPHPAELWERILQSDFELSSSPECRHGFFEVFLTRPLVDAEGPVVQELYDDNGDVRVRLSLDKARRPNGVGLNECAIALNETAEWRRLSDSRWAFVADGEHLSSFSSELSSIPPGDTSHIRLHLKSYLASAMGSETPTAVWSEASSTLLAMKQDGSVVRLRFRSPHDQRRFGTILSELVVLGVDRSSVALRGFIVDRQSPLRLNIADARGLPERLGVVEGNDDSNRSVRLISAAAIPASGRLQAEIPPLNCPDAQEPKNPKFRSSFHEMIVAHNLFAIQRINPTLAENRPYEMIEPWTIKLVGELEAAYLAIERAIVEDSADPMVDDPNLLWLGFERAVDAPTAASLMQNLITGPLRSAQVPLRAKVRLCMAIGELGPPAWGTVGIPPLGNDEAFLKAILAARWNRFASAPGIKACHAKLAEVGADLIEREAAIDSLVRWGRLEDVPQDQLDDWFQTKLAATPTHRHCTWKALTRHADGRRFLRERLDSLASQPDIRRDIATMLCHRAHATLDMQRFDFMTADECRQTLELCQPLVADTTK